MSGGESRTAPDGDRSLLLSEYGVSGRQGNTNILVNDTEDDCHHNESGLSEKGEKGQFGKAMQLPGQYFGDKHIARVEKSVKGNSILVLLVALNVLLVFGVGFVVCNMLLMKINMQDMQREQVILQDRVTQLEKECQEKWQDTVVVATADGGKVVFRRPGDDTDGGADLSPWKTDDLASYFQQHLKQGSGDISEEDADDQDDNGDDDVVNAQDDDDDNNSDAEDASNDGIDSSSTLLHRDRRQANKESKNKKSKRGGGNKKFCNRVDKCIKDSNSHKECHKILECIPAPVPEPFKIKAVHFMSKFWRDEGGKMSRSDFGQKSCLFMAEWDGLACRNRTVRIPYNLTGSNEVPLRNLETPLKMLVPADWMAKLYPDQAGQPLVPDNNGGYIVQESGLYLIYSSVLFHDVKHRQSQAVVVNGTKLFKCVDSVDYIGGGLPADANQAKYKTCAMTGVTQLTKGERLEVQNLYANTEIDLSTDATYFGAVLLASNS